MNKKLLAGLAVGAMMFGMGGVATAAPIIGIRDGHVYELVNGKWDEAEAQAKAKGGHLVTINDRAEGLWLKQTFNPDSYKCFWIGFNDIANEGNWVWTSGEAVTYTNWATNEPNNSGGEDVAIMGVWHSIEWNDLPQAYDETNIQGIAEYASAPTPEPATMLLLGTGLAALAARKLKKQLPA
jgi:hypothetical protein